MKPANMIFIFGIVGCAIAANAESLLHATTFPKTFNDLPFEKRWEILAEGYGVFDRQYDANGNCVIGCPYAGITIQQDQYESNLATQEYASTIDDIIEGNITVHEVTNNQTAAESINQNNTESNNNQAANISSNNQQQSGGIYHSAITQNTPSNNPAQSNGNSNSDVTLDSIPLRSPVKDDSVFITSDFYFRTASSVQGWHGAVDIGVKYGTPVVATGDGTVVMVDRKTNTYNGPYVKIQHAKGFYSWYLHLSKINVESGQRVKKGQVIGASGGTSKECKRCTGTGHLDYRISMEKSGRDIWIDILCPCRATKKKPQTFNQSVSPEYNQNVAEYQCRHSSFWHDKYYSFIDAGTKQRGAKWRVAANHCMQNMNDKLPDEK